MKLFIIAAVSLLNFANAMNVENEGTEYESIEYQSSNKNHFIKPTTENIKNAKESFIKTTIIEVPTKRIITVKQLCRAC